MIGGYLFGRIDAQVDGRIRERLGPGHVRVEVGDGGYLFSDRPSARLVSDDLIVLSPDLLVVPGTDGEYHEFDLAAEFAPLFARGPATAFDAISSDARFAVVQRFGERTRLHLSSHRAGAGRLYYRRTEGGVLFASDLRFLLGVLGGRVEPLALYAILKYGAVPEPLTIVEGVRAVPPGHYVTLDPAGGEERAVPFFRFSFPCDAEPDEAAMLRPVEEALRRAARFLARRRPAILLSGGIDSSLFGAYLAGAAEEPLRGFYCAFGDGDPELAFARDIADAVGADLHVAGMGLPDALAVLDDVTALTGHPFADFSSLPIAFLLQRVRERVGAGAMLVECNGGDDCFGFPDLANERKFRLKHGFPRSLKRVLAATLARTGYWKWATHEGLLARLSAVADAHEGSPLDYFLVLAPVGYLRLRRQPGWDRRLRETLEDVFEGCGEDRAHLAFQANTTIRQLLQVNSRRWAAKALSVGETLGLGVVYPYIWREVLVEQGRLPWDAKVRGGVVKWPLKRLLEAHMPASFIYRKKSGFVPPFAAWLTDETFNGRAREVLLDGGARVRQIVPARVLDGLLSEAGEGRRLRHSVLNFLWGALFSELWLARHTPA